MLKRFREFIILKIINCLAFQRSYTALPRAEGSIHNVFPTQTSLSFLRVKMYTNFILTYKDNRLSLRRCSNVDTFCCRHGAPSDSVTSRCFWSQFVACFPSISWWALWMACVAHRRWTPNTTPPFAQLSTIVREFVNYACIFNWRLSFLFPTPNTFWSSWLCLKW